MPYATQENQTDGVVITFTDITMAKNLETALRKAQSDLEKRFTHQTVELGKAGKICRPEFTRKRGPSWMKRRRPGPSVGRNGHE